ncbi:MAG: DUF3467 domain-containing protein [Phycisphaeraceae bacterium]
MREEPRQMENAPSANTEQSGGRRVRLRIDERNLSTSYTNAFRSRTSLEEVILEFGLNLVQPAHRKTDADTAGTEGGGTDATEMLFQVNDRLIMNYATAKRLALTLTQIIQRYEQQIGEIKLPSADRSTPEGG